MNTDYPDDLDLSDLPPQEQEALRRLAAWQPPPIALERPVPGIEEMLGTLSCPDWLRAVSASLAASVSPVEQVASLGVVARLWTGTRQERQALLAGVDGADPNTRILAWARSLSDQDIRCVEGLAIASAELLLHDLVWLQETAVETPEQVLSLARTIIWQRDALESVAFILGALGIGARLRTVLSIVDDEAPAYFSAFPTAEELSCEHIWEVFASEPDAWWGSFAC